MMNQEDCANCPVCLLQDRCDMEGREPTMSEMKQAFRKSKEMGAIVGGDFE